MVQILARARGRPHLLPQRLPSRVTPTSGAAGGWSASARWGLWREPGRAGAGRRGRAGGESGDAVKRPGRRGARWCGLASEFPAGGWQRSGGLTNTQGWAESRRYPSGSDEGHKMKTFLRSHGVGTEPRRQLSYQLRGEKLAAGCAGREAGPCTWGGARSFLWTAAKAPSCFFHLFKN